MNYYNEIDKYAAQWLRNLISAGHIAPGDVDERSIEDVTPKDLTGYRQCHFFAGIGVWSHALRLAGWPDDRPIWTGSCPCQPFSAAGKGGGFADERHLWPAFFHLISQCLPPTVIGEQVASSDIGPWLDLVQADLEAVGYAFGAVPIPAAGVGAPHIRDRLWWVADSGKSGLERGNQRAMGDEQPTAERGSGIVGMEHGTGDGNQDRKKCPGRNGAHDSIGSGGMGDADSDGAGRISARFHRPQAGESGRGCSDDAGTSGATPWRSPTNGHWRDADWLYCRDGKWRPVEPGTSPLAHGITNRVGRLRAYGNAIVPQVAAEVILVCLGCRP